MGFSSLCPQIPVPATISPSISSASCGVAFASASTSPFSFTPASASLASKSSASAAFAGFFFFFFLRAVGSNSPSAAGVASSPPSAASSLGFFDDFFFLPKPLKRSVTSSTAGSFAGAGLGESSHTQYTVRNLRATCKLTEAVTFCRCLVWRSTSVDFCHFPIRGNDCILVAERD